MPRLRAERLYSAAAGPAQRRAPYSPGLGLDWHCRCAGRVQPGPDRHRRAQLRMERPVCRDCPAIAGLPALSVPHLCAGSRAGGRRGGKAQLGMLCCAVPAQSGTTQPCRLGSRCTMEGPFTPQQRQIAAVAEEIGRTVLEPNAEELDRTGMYPRANLLQTARAGLNGLLLPSELGGLGLDHTSYALVAHTLAQYCPSTTMVYVMHMTGAQA